MAITALKSGCKLPIKMSINKTKPCAKDVQFPLRPPLKCVQLCESLTISIITEKTSKDSKNDSPKAFSALMKFTLPHYHLAPIDHLTLANVEADQLHIMP